MANDNTARELEPSPWLTVDEAASRAKCSKATILRNVQRGKLRAAKLTARREFRFHVEWIDAWISESAEILNPDAPAGGARLAKISRLGR